MPAHLFGKNEKILKFERMRRRRLSSKITKVDLARKQHNLNNQSKTIIKSGGDLKSYLFNSESQSLTLDKQVSGDERSDRNGFVVVEDLKLNDKASTYQEIINRVLKIGNTNNTASKS